MTRENSGLIDLDALLREARETAATDLAKPPSVRPPAPPESLEGLTTSASTTSATVPRAPVEPPSADVTANTAVPKTSAPKAEKTARARIPVTVAVGVVIAIVAVGAWLGKVPRGAPRSTPIAAAQMPTERPAASPVSAGAQAAGVLRADDLPSAPTAASFSPTPAAHVAAVDRRPLPSTASTITIGDTAASLASPAGSLGDAMHAAVGRGDEAPAETTSAPAGVHATQLKPSQGAVVGAIGSVLPTARACLRPNDGVRSGLVVFKSDGTVARVELGDKNSEDECIRAALAKARVAPFVEDTYATRVAVRP